METDRLSQVFSEVLSTSTFERSYGAPGPYRGAWKSGGAPTRHKAATFLGQPIFESYLLPAYGAFINARASQKFPLSFSYTHAHEPNTFTVKVFQTNAQSCSFTF